MTQARARFAPDGRIRAALYSVLWRCSEIGGRPGNAFLFVAAGLLRADELHLARQEEWSDHNASVPAVDFGLWGDEQRFYERFLRPSERVLLAGCGTGRDLIALSAMGYDVVGLDQSPAAVELARMHLARRGMSVPVRTGDVESAELDDNFDAVIFAGGCYSFVRDSQVRIAALRRIRAHLPPGGRVLLFYHPFTGQSRIGRWLVRTSARLARADWSPEPGDVFSRYRSNSRAVRYRHDFEPAELAAECAAAGLRVVADEEFKPVLRFAAALPASTG
jgi:SAM-dependent methyltransferase